MRLEKLTESEKKFAEENHNLVYGFLHRYKYSIGEYYNVVVFAYLKSVQVYHRRKDLQNKCDFPFISWQYMRSAIGNHFRIKNTQKRTATYGTVSFDSDNDDMENFYNCIGGKSAEDDVMEKMLIENIMENLTELQRKIAELRIKGYNNKETYLMLQISSSTYYKERQRIRATVESLIG